MKNLLQLLGLACLLTVAQIRADIAVDPWQPLYRGIDHTVGRNTGNTTYSNNGTTFVNSTLQVVNCLRIDLTEPTIRLLPTPRATNYVANSVETYSLSVSNFIKQTGVKVATVANFYNTVQGNDPTSEGVAAQVFGFSMSTGQVVSMPDFGPDSNNRRASILFTSNNVASLMLTNAPTNLDTNGIYNAVTGYYAVLTNGVILGGALSSLYPDPTYHQLQPRTIFGLSQDRRYLFMIIIDGRQPGYSDGSNDADMGFWLLQFGAWDGVAMDGGGSASMYMADCVGNPVALGHSSYIGLRQRERITGSHLGIYAEALPEFNDNVQVNPGSTTAVISWTTETPATSRVEYGLTTSYGLSSVLNTNLSTNHVVTLTGLQAGRTYYYRVHATVGGNDYTSSCGTSSFTTTNVGAGQVFGLTRNWKYNTNNQDGVNWTAAAYDDSGWSNGVGALWADSRSGTFPSPNANLIPNYTTGTRMPAGTYPFTTYYFRSTFVFSNNPSGVKLTFSNYIDDGAVFHLNGVEVYRTNVIAAPTPVSGTSNAIAFSFSDATGPIVFELPPGMAGLMVQGTNQLAVEVHNYRNPSGGNPSPDVTFESALYYQLPDPPPPFITNLLAVAGETNAIISWETLSNATSQVFYGMTTAYGQTTSLDPTLVTGHSVTISGLNPATTYHFQVRSVLNGVTNTEEGTFSTTTLHLPVVSTASIWRYTTNDLAGQNWAEAGYDDSGWMGQGPALLYVEDNQAVEPRTTLLPSNGGSVAGTYYFRTHFSVNQPLAGLTLLLTNYIDDGAVFYLNGTEVRRVRMPAAPQFVQYGTLAVGCPDNNCDATLDVPDVFRVSGAALAGLNVGGDNVLAVEVHQYEPSGGDMVFGSTAAFVRSLPSETPLRIQRGNGTICLAWDGPFLTLQRSTNLTATNAWTDVVLPGLSGGLCVTNPAATTFYRLR